MSTVPSYGFKTHEVETTSPDNEAFAPSKSHLQMFPSGNYIDLLRPDPRQIDIGDIAHHLSLLCRFTGGVRNFYSVAEHSCLVHDLLIFMKQEGLALAGMLHDATEAFANDVASPIKYAMRYLESGYAASDAQDVVLSQGVVGAYGLLSTKLDEAVAKAFNLDHDQLHSPLLKLADLWALKIEAHHLTTHRGATWSFPADLDGLLKPWPIEWAGGLTPVQAREAFLTRISHHIEI